MKKSMIIVLCCAVVAAAAGVGAWLLFSHDDPAVAATVNGTDITAAQVQARRDYLALSAQNGLSQLETAQGLTEEQKQAMRAELEASANQTNSQILDSLIRQTVILQEAERQGLAVSEDAAYKQGKAAYTALKEAALAADAPADAVQNYAVIQDYMQANSLTEEAYLQTITPVYQQQLSRAALYESYSATAADPGDAAFDAYVDTLVEAANIRRAAA